MHQVFKVYMNSATNKMQYVLMQTSYRKAIFVVSFGKRYENFNAMKQRLFFFVIVVVLDNRVPHYLNNWSLRFIL